MNSGSEVRFTGIHIGSDGKMPYIYSANGDDINFRYTNNSGNTTYVNVEELHSAYTSTTVIAPDSVSLRTKDGKASVQYYNNSVLLHHNIDSSKDYYAYLSLDNTGTARIISNNSTTGYFNEKIVLTGSNANLSLLTFYNDSSNGYAQIYKNNSATADYGLVLEDMDVNDNNASILLRAKEERAYFNSEIYIITGNTQSVTKGIKWSPINSKTPYIGYALDQTDGTFLIGSLTGTNYSSGLAIGGNSGNLLWKGNKVLTVANFSLSNTTLTITT